MTEYQQINAPDAPFVPGGMPVGITQDVIPNFGKMVNPGGAAELYYNKMAETFQNGGAVVTQLTKLINVNAAKEKKRKEDLVKRNINLIAASSETNKAQTRDREEADRRLEELDDNRNPLLDSIENGIFILLDLMGRN